MTASNVSLKDDSCGRVRIANPSDICEVVWRKVAVAHLIYVGHDLID